MTRRGILVATLAAASLAAASVVSAALGIGKSSAGSAAAGEWDSIEAFERTPVETDAPAALLASARRMAAVTSGESEAALQTLRNLRSGLGQDEASIHVFRRADGVPCMIVWRRGGTCAAEDGSYPGVLWIGIGGYPAWARASGVPIPSALAGLAADDVRAVSLVENGVERPLEIVRNTFFIELQAADPEAKWNELRVEYASGVIRTARVPTP